jgi:bacterioferritin
LAIEPGVALALQGGPVPRRALGEEAPDEETEGCAQLNAALKEERRPSIGFLFRRDVPRGGTTAGPLIKKSSIDEMKHAEEADRRLLFLDSVPKMDYMELNVGTDVKGQLQADYQLELNAVAMYNKAVQVSREEGDDISRELFSLLLKDEEQHVEWLEMQLHQMKELGYETYLSNQSEGEKD